MESKLIAMIGLALVMATTTVYTQSAFAAGGTTGAGVKLIFSNIS